MKGKKIISCIALILLALLILLTIAFCLPKKMDFLLGGAEITSFHGTATVISISDGISHHDTWTIDSGIISEDMIVRLEEIMFSCRYRPMLKTLLQPNYFELNGDSSVSLVLTISDGSTLIVDYMGEDLVLLRPRGSYGVILRPGDKETSSRLAEFFIEFGKKT